MKVVRFTWPHPTGGYSCDTPGEQAGPYVPLAEVEAILNDLRAACDILSQSRHAFRSRQIQHARTILERHIKPEGQKP